MLATEIHGKISPNYPPHQRMEDVLTSDVLSMFRYFNDLSLPTAFLRQAKNLKGENLVLPNLNTARIFFWPKFTFTNLGYREPDGLLLLEETGGSRTAAVIEAKYDSGLSNIENGNEEETDGVQKDSFFYGHQIADQYCGMLCGRWINWDINNELNLTAKKVLIYLTAHYEMPKADIKDAIVAIKKRVCNNKNVNCWENAERNIYWVGWRNLFLLVEQFIPQYKGGELNYLRDLQDLLKVRFLKPFQQPFGNLVKLIVYDRMLGKNVNPSTTVYNLNLLDNLTVVSVYEPTFK